MQSDILIWRKYNFEWNEHKIKESFIYWHIWKLLSEKYPNSDEMQNERMNEERNNKAAADKAEHEKFMDNFDCTSYGKVYYNY